MYRRVNPCVGGTCGNEPNCVSDKWERNRTVSSMSAYDVCMNVYMYADSNAGFVLVRDLDMMVQ